MAAALPSSCPRITSSLGKPHRMMDTSERHYSNDAHNHCNPSDYPSEVSSLFDPVRAAIGVRIVSPYLDRASAALAFRADTVALSFVIELQVILIADVPVAISAF
jgi:hypothetical protein